MNKDELLKQKEVLQAELNKLEELIKREDEPAYYIPKMGEKYFYIDEKGDIWSDTWDDENKDIRKHTFGNCYKTFDKAYNTSDIQKDLVRLQRLALTLNRGEKIDWEYAQQDKYAIVYDYWRTRLVQRACYCRQDGAIYCLSNEYLNEAKKLFGEDRLKEILTYQRY